MCDLFKFLELPPVEVPDHPYRKALIDYGPPNERGGRTIMGVTAADPWTPRALEGLTRLHKAKLPLTIKGLMRWLKAGHWETCSHRTLCDVVHVVIARDASKMEEQTPQSAIYIDKLIEHRLAIIRREGSS